MTDPRNDAPLVGRIMPDAKGGKPTFVVLRRDDARYRHDDEMAGVRPCAHRRFILDAKWNTVTCAECKERLDAFPVLLRYAEWQEEMEMKRDLANHASVRLYAGLIRDRMRRTSVTPEERAEAEEVLQRHGYGHDVEAVKACADKLEKIISQRRQAKRRSKRGAA